MKQYRAELDADRQKKVRLSLPFRSLTVVCERNLVSFPCRFKSIRNDVRLMKKTKTTRRKRRRKTRKRNEKRKTRKNPLRLIAGQTVKKKKKVPRSLLQMMKNRYLSTCFSVLLCFLSVSCSCLLVEPSKP
jgi:hypothetical protein